MRGHLQIVQETSDRTQGLQCVEGLLGQIVQ